MTHSSLPLFIFSAWTACCAVSEEIPQYYTLGDSGYDSAIEQEKKADLRVFYGSDQRLDIYVRTKTSGGLASQTFTLDELKLFFEKQGRDRYVCVTLHPLSASSGELREKQIVASLAEYFFARGLKRVRIHKATGLGLGVLYDRTRASGP
jgi:hypothetical protein